MDSSSNEESVPAAALNDEYIPKIGLGERYQCKYCRKRFRFKSVLDEHTSIHGNFVNMNICQYFGIDYYNRFLSLLWKSKSLRIARF